jgi:hypothetical protein
MINLLFEFALALMVDASSEIFGVTFCAISLLIPPYDSIAKLSCVAVELYP